VTTEQDQRKKSIAQTLEQALRQEGRQRMAGATITFLKKHAPFNKMTADALQDFAQKAQIAFYPAGSTDCRP
jgi:CBS domain-containing protein